MTDSKFPGSVLSGLSKNKGTKLIRTLIIPDVLLSVSA